MTLTAPLNYDCHEDSAGVSTWIPFSFSRKSVIVDGTNPEEGPEDGADLVHGIYLCASCSVVKMKNHSRQWQNECHTAPRVLGSRTFLNFSATHVD